LIRKFLTFLVFAALLLAAGWYYAQAAKLQQLNEQLTIQNTHLTNELARHKERKGKQKFVTELAPIDPSTDAERHLGKAELALKVGNIGDALDECKLAAADIQTASESTSSAVHNSVSSLQAKLDSVQKETMALLRKLGA
jgi:hypothetical protein